MSRRVFSTSENFHKISFHDSLHTLIIFNEVYYSVLHENTCTQETDDGRREVPYFAVKSFWGRCGNFWIGGLLRIKITRNLASCKLIENKPFPE